MKFNNSKSKLKKLILTTIFILLPTFCFSATGKYQDDKFSLVVNYTDTVTPGDAVFVRLSIQPYGELKKQKNIIAKNSVLELKKDDKKIDQAAFYSIPKQKKSNIIEVLAGIPLSTWLSNGEYSIKISFNITENQYKEFTIPLTFTQKTFFEEVIELNEKNTEIKTDNSPKRAAQIDKLNDIIFTTMPNDVYALGKMKVPTTSTRYTSYFGDRRTYTYTNGKSSTSIHHGNDYGVPTGTPINSCAAGRVVMAEDRISTGYSIVIEHLPGLYSLYYHLSELLVKEGDMIKQGELIGKSGATGLATGPHLHWEMRLNGASVRPEFFLDNFTFEQE